LQGQSGELNLFSGIGKDWGTILVKGHLWEAIGSQILLDSFSRGQTCLSQLLEVFCLYQHCGNDDDLLAAGSMRVAFAFYKRLPDRMLSKDSAYTGLKTMKT
jgi:hypothetical protein